MCEFKKNVLRRRAGPVPCLGCTLELTLLAGTQVRAGELTPFPRMPQQQSGAWVLHLAWAEWWSWLWWCECG